MSLIFELNSPGVSNRMFGKQTKSNTNYVRINKNKVTKKGPKYY